MLKQAFIIGDVMQNEEEMMQLKALYEELWSDAKTMIKDMRRSISMYQLSGFLLLMFSLVFFQRAFVTYFDVFAGTAEFWDYYSMIVNTFGTIVLIILGIHLLRWYYKLKDRYAKLVQMEKTIED